MALWRARVASSSAFSSISSINFLKPFSIFNNNGLHASRSFSSDAAKTYSRTLHESMMNQMMYSDINSQIGSCMPLSAMRIGTIIHNIELNPGQGGKLVRAAGTNAKILKEPASRYCLVQLPSGVKKLIDSRCRATIGTVSNPTHGDRKLRKAGQSRWLGRRPVVRGVAMNPVDHPHGGGEGKSKSSGKYGRVSVSPWGKPTKGGFKTGPLKRRRNRGAYVWIWIFFIFWLSCTMTFFRSGNPDLLIFVAGTAFFTHRGINIPNKVSIQGGHIGYGGIWEDDMDRKFFPFAFSLHLSSNMEDLGVRLCFWLYHVDSRKC